jgi:glycogen operon protein
MLATLLFSQGTPMLLAGDEFGNSQGGNNNAYAQDNDCGWLDWRGLEEDPGFTDKVREMVQLRRQLPLLRPTRYLHGRTPIDRGCCDIAWLHRDGRPMVQNDWAGAQQFSLLYNWHEGRQEHSPVTQAIAIFYNASAEESVFTLPHGLPLDWVIRFYSSDIPPAQAGPGQWELGARSLVLATMGLGADS